MARNGLFSVYTYYLFSAPKGGRGCELVAMFVNLQNACKAFLINENSLNLLFSGRGWGGEVRINATNPLWAPLIQVHSWFRITTSIQASRKTPSIATIHLFVYLPSHWVGWICYNCFLIVQDFFFRKFTYVMQEGSCFL